MTTRTDSTLAKQTEMSILYLDDNPAALENFQNNINQYNSVADNPNYIGFRPIKDPEDAADILLEGCYNIFLCDQNMKDKKGIELWEYIIGDHNHGKQIVDNTLFVLYTTPNPALTIECEEKQIPLAFKSENFEQNLHIIKEAYKRKFKRYLEDLSALRHLYDKYMEELMEDLVDDPTIKLYLGKNTYTSDDLKMELKGRTSLGVQFVQDYIDGLNFLRTK